MRQIQDVEPVDAGDGQRYTTAQFVKYLIGHSQHFTINYDAISKASRMMASIDLLLFEEGDWDSLCMAAKNPTCPYPVTPAHLNKRFVDAILNAQKTDAAAEKKT